MEIDSGLNGHLGTMGKKKRRPWGWRRMRCYDTWERRAVRLCGVRWGGAVGLAVLWPTRRAAPRCGFLVRARGPSAAWDADRWQRWPVAVWAFLYELTASPLAAP